MSPLKLHTKTTLVASAVTIAVLAAALAITNERVAELVREEQKARAELQAINLAEQISHMPAPRDPQALAHAATVASGARPGVVRIRIWERVGGVYVETAASPGSEEPAAAIPEETKAALRNGLSSSLTNDRPENASNSLYRVFAPVADQGRFSGAVEVVEQLDDAPSIAVRYERMAIWIVLAAVALITLATYLLFRRLIYRPIERLLEVMSQAESGDLAVKAPARAPDELGLLSRAFNRMIERIRIMTEEREGQRLVLQERVRDATAELEQRNEQLEEANLELWRTTRRLTELERLAAAGQTAAQFAHEVGTPLNLISGHVQLLRTRLGPDEGALQRLETIGVQIERIERIVRGMLDRTRPEAIEQTALDLNALLERIFDATAPTLDARGVRLVTTLGEGLPRVAGDADRLQQVFINLINNALDAMPDGGELRIRTGVESGTQGAAAAARVVAVEFADTGSGMAEDVRLRIFDPLYTTKERGRGTGLGLVVVRQVMSDHHGAIEVESETGRGTRFLLRFPAMSKPDEEEESAETVSNRGAEAGAQTL
ncbi:MAG TPA: ATP-binding protein [Pyrinomonadaceae bacterium]|jgi:signal transduction histidine kinase|nr:ATP-binding protein [Pyrinomonadaceae bacterium]